MYIWRSLGGIVEVEVTSADPASTLLALNQADIPVYQVRQTGDLNVCFQIDQSYIPAVKRICEKRGENLSIRDQKGVFWIIKRMLYRPVLITGIIILIGMSIILPARVLFVSVEGNVTIPDNKILEAAAECGIRFGASRREVRSERIKNALLEAMPDLQWAGVNTAGCVATISVRERTPAEEQESESDIVSIVASRDGVVSYVTATQGTAMCSVGQAVQKGQTLISGYTDCGIYIQATRAQGEVYARTERKIDLVMPTQLLKRSDTRGTEKKYSILLGKNRIKLWKGSGIWDSSCGRMYEEYYVTLPGGFRLPVGIAVEEIVCWETVSSTSEVPDSEMLLYADNYLSEHMVAGIIQDKTVQFTETEGRIGLTGNYVCTEMIGRVQREQIGELHGKIN